MTLIELVIVIAVLSIVMSSAYLVFSFGLKTFQDGTSRVDAQSKARIIATNIEKQTSRAMVVVLSNDSDNVCSDILENLNEVDSKDDFNLIYFDESNGKVYLEENSSKTEIASNISSLSFDKKGNRRFEYLIEVEYDDKYYQLSSEVTLLDPRFSKVEIVDTEENSDDFNVLWYHR
nr:prepilin-type N-terminal cleavage/methylation domain-containing protein [Natranaerofaba carboxydovora]